jgi:NTE family protein
LTPDSSEASSSRTTPLPVETVGASNHNLIEKCSQDTELAKDPARRDPSLFALSFSGGGWRAALTAAGVLRFVSEAGLLRQVRWVSSVSGGSITNGLLAVSYQQLRDADFAPSAVDEHVLAPLLGASRDRSLTRGLLRNIWRAPRRTRTGVLADVLADWLGFNELLSGLSSECHFTFNAANETTGVRFNFDRERIGDYVIGHRATAGTSVRVADAVACSAAVPGAFSAMPLRGLKFPCGDGKDVRLVDGGVYDNLGLEALDDLHGPCLIITSAGGVLRTGMHGLVNWIPFVKDLKRSEALLYRQSTALRTRTMLERFKVWEGTPRGQHPDFARQGVLFGIGTTMDNVPESWSTGRDEFPNSENPLELAEYKTTFNKLSPYIAEALVHRGWWLTGATLCAYHPDLVSGELPHWRQLPSGARD